MGRHSLFQTVTPENATEKTEDQGGITQQKQGRMGTVEQYGLQPQ